MDNAYRTIVPIALWLGLAAFVLALLMMLAGRPFFFGLTPGGIVRGGQTLLLVAVAGYCAYKATARP